MACWDAVGKKLDRPVSELLGGTQRREVDFISYLFYRYEGKEGIPPIDSPASMLRYHEKLDSAGGKFLGAKIKGGVFSPEDELETVKLFRETIWQPFPPALRPERGLVRRDLDPHAEADGAGQPGVRGGPDPVHRGHGEGPQGGEHTVLDHMCVIWFNQIMPAVRLGAIDMIQEDLHFWGGFALNRKLVGIAETLQLGLAIHSDRELGISTAAVLHFTAANPYLTHPIDSHYHHQLDDIITEPFHYKDGRMKVPTGPGLGVEIDRKKLEEYHQAYRQQGDVNEFYDPSVPTGSRRCHSSE